MEHKGGQGPHQKRTSPRFHGDKEKKFQRPEIVRIVNNIGCPLAERWGRIAGSLYEVKKIQNLIVILETKDGKNQILTFVSSLPVFYDKKEKVD